MDALQHVQGLAELQRTLDALPAKLEANLLRGALRAGAKVLADEAKRRVPVLHGDLKKSIRVSVRINRRLGRVEAVIKAGSGKKALATYLSGGRQMVRSATPWYARLVEKGTRPHSIKPRKARALALQGKGRTVEAVDHPGARPKPFMAPAFDAKATAAINAFADYLRRRVPLELKKTA